MTPLPAPKPPKAALATHGGFHEEAAQSFVAASEYTPQDLGSLNDLIDGFQATAIAGKIAQMPTRDLARLIGEHFSADEISELIVPKRTLARRIALREPLSPDETDRAIRVASVSVNAERTFGNADKAQEWLRRANPALGRQRPIDLMRSEAGTQAVNELLGQIDHGMFV